MNCKQVQVRLADYSSRKCDQLEAEHIRRHIDECSACRRVLAEESALVQRLEAMPQAAPSKDLWACIAANLDAGTERVPLLKSWRRWCVAVAAATSIAAAAYLGNITMHHRATSHELTVDEIAWVAPSMQYVSQEPPADVVMTAAALPSAVSE